jgi:hypothetical protein
MPKASRPTALEKETPYEIISQLRDLKYYFLGMEKELVTE